MMTVHEVSRLTGVSIRTLQYYDRIGLLMASAHTEAGYRLYDDTALEKLQQILLFRELQFPLKDIAHILASPNFDRSKALQQQIELLLQKEQLESLIALARGLLETGERIMDFSVFDKTKQETYARKAKEVWSNTDAYREFEKKQNSPAENQAAGEALMSILAGFGAMQALSPDASDVQNQVKKLQAHITEHFYTCTPMILAQLGKMYAAGGEFTENIDSVGGPGTAAFAAKAIEVYCKA